MDIQDCSFVLTVTNLQRMLIQTAEHGVVGNDFPPSSFGGFGRVETIFRSAYCLYREYECSLRVWFYEVDWGVFKGDRFIPGLAFSRFGLTATHAGVLE